MTGLRWAPGNTIIINYYIKIRFKQIVHMIYSFKMIYSSQAAIVVIFPTGTLTIQIVLAFLPLKNRVWAVFSM